MHRPVSCVLLIAVLGTVAVGTQDSFRLQGEIPGVITEGTPLEVVVGGFQGLEGPVGALDGALYFSDIPANRTYKIDANGMMSVWRENTNGANGLFITKDGRLLAAEGGGRRIVAVTPDGRVMPLATQFNGQSLRAPNDLIVDSKGGIYFTDPAPRPAPDVAPKEPGNVYYLTPNGDVLLVDAQIERPNGITLSLDEKTLYVGNTEGEFVYAFDVQADGRVANKREFVKLREPEKGSRGLRSRADGGAMGIHYVNGKLIEDEVIDIAHPEAVMYEPGPDGKLTLIAVEYITTKGPAELDGHLFSFTNAPNRYGLPAFYELHVWAWRQNPTGAFADMNPNVSCDAVAAKAN